MTFTNIIRGVAIGDAWGDPNEFHKIAELTRKNVRGPDLPQKMRITDDTQMTLALASALDESRDGSMDDVKEAIQKAFLEYYADPDNNRAPGVTVMGSLARLDQGKSWQDATSTHSDGSGTVMRTSPVAFVTEDRWVGIAAFAAAVTHGTANGIAAAILNVAILRNIMAGNANIGNLLGYASFLANNPEDMGLLDTGEWLDGYEVPGGLESGFRELARLIDIAFTKLPALRAQPWALESDPSLYIGGGGWRAHETLVIALLAADMLPNEPMEALRRSTVTDGDSDTIAAVTGALLGALYPNAFVAGEVWEVLRDRFEPRYRRWIEDECSEYEFVPAKPESWFKRLLTR